VTGRATASNWHTAHGDAAMSFPAGACPTLSQYGRGPREGEISSRTREICGAPEAIHRLGGPRRPPGRWAALRGLKMVWVSARRPGR
jgi:hypothetical protein